MKQGRSNSRIAITTRPGRERGVTLIELMISLVLGLLLTAAIMQIFLRSRSTYDFSDGLSLIQENARFALEHVAGSTRMAGSIGCLTNVGIVNNLTGAANPFRDDLVNGVQGYEAAGTTPGESFAAGDVDPAPLDDADSWEPALPDELGDPARVIPGSDVLVVRNVSGAASPLVSPFSDGDQLHVGAPADFLPGELLVVTDCQKASIFQASGVEATAFGADIDHDDTAMTPGNSAPGSWGSDQGYGIGSEVGRLETIAFYTGQGESGSPSLYQLRLQRTDDTTSAFQPEELVEGIETMQVRYGLDSNDDRQVDTWATAGEVDAANDWAAVLSVEVTLLARVPQESGTDIDDAVYNVGGTEFDPVEDRRLRKVFSTTIGLRNRLP
jgi:type IV pilus assembly protein PilW